MKKLLTILMLGMFLISFASAIPFDNVKVDTKWNKELKADYKIDKTNIKYNKLWEKYEPVRIDNIFGLGKKLFEGAITDHTESCGTNCFSQLEIYTSGDDAVVDKTIFYTINDDESLTEQSIRSYQWYVKTGGSQIEVNDYEWQCVNAGTSPNGTAIQDCNNVLIGSHQEESPEWTVLSEGEVLPEGTYTIKLKGDKKASRTVDWVMETNGKVLSEWATWETAPVLKQSNTIDLGNSLNNGAKAHSFQANSTYELRKIAVSLYALAGVQSSIPFSIMTSNGTIPTGSNLTLGTLDISTINATKGRWFEATLNTPYNLTSGTNYSIVLWMNDDTNLYWSFGNAGDTPGQLSRLESGTWNPTPGAIGIGYGFSFQTYGLSGNAYINLNSPADASISQSPNIQFNGTSTVTGGATLVNMSLWTNETGSWALRNSTNTITAVNSTTAVMIGSTVTGVDNLVGYSGIEFTPNKTVKLKDVWLFTGDFSFNGDQVQLKFANGTSIVNATVSGYKASFDAQLTSGQSYHILGGNADGSSIQHVYIGSASYPLTNAYGNINRGFDTYGANRTDIYMNIRNVTFGDASDSTYTTTWNRTITDLTLWNVQACDSDGDCGFATSNYTVSVDTTAPSVTIDYPTGSITTLANGQTVDLNTTISDSNLDACWYDYNGVNTTIPSCADYNFTYASGVDTLTVYANDTVGNLGSNSSIWTLKILENSQTYSSSTVEGAIENFYANVTLGSGIDISTAVLSYNGTNTTSGITSDGDDRILSVESLTIPNFAGDVNVSFNWVVTLDDATVFYLSTQTQSVGSVNLDNCATNTFQLFNLSLLDEETRTSINGDIEAIYDVLNTNYETIETYSGEFTNVSNTLVCSNINLTSTDLYYSSEIRYSANDYAPELYHIQRADIEEGGDTINLFDLALNDSTEFKLTYQDNSFNFVEGAIIQLQRKYISEDLYEVVEAPLTSNEGISVVHIDLNSRKYRATVVKDGMVLDTFDNIVFKCNNELSGDCEQKLLGEIDPQNSVDYDTQRDFAYTVTPGNNSITVSFSIPSTTPATVNIALTQKDQFGSSTNCNKTILSSAGSLQCTFNDSLVISYLELEISRNGEIIATNTYVIDEDTGMDFVGDNYILVIVLMLSLVGMALTSPEWMAINALVTLLMAGMMWLVKGISFVEGLGMLMWLVIALGILVLKFSKQEDK